MRNSWWWTHPNRSPVMVGSRRQRTSWSRRRHGGACRTRQYGLNDTHGVDFRVVSQSPSRRKRCTNVFVKVQYRRVYMVTHLTGSVQRIFFFFFRSWVPTAPGSCTDPSTGAPDWPVSFLRSLNFSLLDQSLHYSSYGCLTDRLGLV